MTGGWYQTGPRTNIYAAESLARTAGGLNPLGGSYKATFFNPGSTAAGVDVYAICVTP